MTEQKSTIRLAISRITINETDYPLSTELVIDLPAPRRPRVGEPDGQPAEDWRLLLRNECADLQGYGRYVQLARAMLRLQREGKAPRVMIPYGEGATWCTELSRILGWNVSWKALNRQINILSRCRNFI